MADEDLVSQVKIEGIDAAGNKFTALGNAGEEAFKKIGDSAAQASAKTDRAFSGVTKGLEDLKKAAPKPGSFGSFDQLQASLGRVAQGVETAGRAFGPFVERTRKLVRITAGVSVGFATLAAVIAKNFDKAGKSTETFADEQIRSMGRAQQAQGAQFSFAQSIAGLNRQLGLGKITFKEYDDQLQELKFSYKQQQEAIRFTQNQEEALRKETERLQLAAAKQKAWNDLVDLFGGPLAGAILTAGRAVESFVAIIQRSLGPPIAAVIGRVVALFEQNKAAIEKTFNTLGAAIQKFADDGGVERAFNVVLQTLQFLVAFIGGVVVPVINGLVAALQPVADGINAIFGTKVTGGVLLAVIAIGFFTKSFTILFGLINAAVGVIGALGGAFGVLRTALAAIPLVLQLIVIAFRSLLIALGPIGIAFLAISLAIAALQASGVDVMGVLKSVVAVIAALPGQIGAFFSQIGSLIKATFNDAIAAVNAKIEEWVTFLSALPGRIGAFFVELGNAIVSSISSAIAQVGTFFSDLLAKAKQFIQPVIDMVKFLLSLLGAAGGSVEAAGGGQIGKGFDGGGPVRGPGTARSDDIPAWLSNGEFVMQTRAVREWGGAFMRAINSGALSPSDIFGYAMGGLVSPVRMPRYSDGGPVIGGGNRTPINLHLSDGTTIAASAGDADAQKLVRYAVNKRAKATGRKPTWVGGR